jgi:hypothetical protein
VERPVLPSRLDQATAAASTDGDALASNSLRYRRALPALFDFDLLNHACQC